MNYQTQPYQAPVEHCQYNYPQNSPEQNRKESNFPRPNERIQPERRDMRDNPNPNVQISPIGNLSKHNFETEEFLNLDEMSEDLSKMLASSKNQEEIMKAIGINKKEDFIPGVQYPRK